MVILLVTPSPLIQAERLQARGDDEEHVARPLVLAAREEPEGRRLADHVVLNDSADRAGGRAAGYDCCLPRLLTRRAEGVTWSTAEAR